MNPAEKFRAAMHADGLDFTGPIVADGKFHRFKAGDDHARNSWYLFHDGVPAAGAFGCWKRGFKETWCDRNGHLSQDEWQDVRQRWAEAERERVQTETERQAKARAMASWILNRSRPARTLDRYLSRKGIKIFGNLREYRGALVLPLRDASGDLHSLQFISDNGSKRFLTGGRIAGCSFTVADVTDGTLVLCEGFATGASIHEATGFAVVCAMHAGNMKSVADELRNKFPSREIIVAADNDQFTAGNPGLTKATEAALAIRAKLATPEFQDVSTKPTDFNDLHQLAGLADVAQQINAAKPVAGSKPFIELPEESDEPEAAPFPIDALPTAMAGLIAATSRCAHVPLAMPAVCVLGVVSAVIGAGLEIISGPDRTTSANLFLLASGESGSGKSESCRPIIAPLIEYQATLLETWKQVTHPNIQAEIARRDAERKALEKKIARAMRPDSPDSEELQRLQAQLAYPIARADELKQRTAPSIIADDFTIEALAMRLRDNRETMFCFSSDARKPIQNLLGRYNPGKTTDESLLLKGYTRESLRVDRAKGDPINLHKPCLALCWFVQPDLLATMLDEESLNASGLLARLLLCHTYADWVKFDRNRQGIPDSTRAQWAELTGSLLATYHDADKPFCVAATPEAEQVLDHYQHAIFDRRSELADVKVFAARWCENAWRVALTLHAALHGSEAHHHPLAGETAANAVRVVEWFAASQLDILAKGRHAAAAMVQDEVLKLLQERMQGRHLEPEERQRGCRIDYITSRSVHRARITVTADAATALLARMEANRLLESEAITPAHGGKTSKIFRRIHNPMPE